MGGLLELVGGEEISYSLLEKIQVWMTSLENNRELKQLSSHFILMAGCSFCAFKAFLNKFFSKNSKWFTIFSTLSFIVLFSFFIEFIQSLLPSSFERGFAWADILISIIGGLTGIVMIYILDKR